MRPLKPGWHRVIARDGTRIGMLVDDDGRIVEFMQLEQGDPPKRSSSKFVGTVAAVRERAERRRLERELRLWEEIAKQRPGGIGGL